MALHLVPRIPTFPDYPGLVANRVRVWGLETEDSISLHISLTAWFTCWSVWSAREDVLPVVYPLLGGDKTLAANFLIN